MEGQPQGHIQNILRLRKALNSTICQKKFQNFVSLLTNLKPNECNTNLCKNVTPRYNQTLWKQNLSYAISYKEEFTDTEQKKLPLISLSHLNSMDYPKPK